MLHQDQRDRVDVVLVSPRNPLNIGAAARAMANFGFSRLAVAAPYAPNWREARSAIGAPHVLQNATESKTLAEALAHCTLVAGTGTLTRRKPDQPGVSLPALAPVVAAELARGGHVALVFGSEKHGLTREDLSLCHILVEIPTDSRQPSMNLGQAVAVCLYELTCRGPACEAAPLGANIALLDNGQQRKPDPASPPSEFARPTAPVSALLDRLADLIEQTMDAAGYSPRSMQAANRHDLRLLLRRLNLSALDTRRILGLFRRILWRLTSRHD